MTFRGFLLNYLSPWYFLLRLFWLGSATIAFFFTSAILVGQGWSPNGSLVAAVAVASTLAWIALKPWKVGASYNDIKNGVRILEEKLRKR